MYKRQKLNFSSVRSSIAAAKIRATKFLKKLFCIDGKSPASRTKVFIIAKQNADIIMHIMPFVLLDLKIFPTFR